MCRRDTYKFYIVTYVRSCCRINTLLLSILSVSVPLLAVADGGALTTAEAVSGSVPYKSCTLDSGTEAHWYQRTEDVPKGWPRSQAFWLASLF